MFGDPRKNGGISVLNEFDVAKSEIITGKKLLLFC